MSTEKATDSAIRAANLMIEDGMPPEFARALETDEQKTDRVRKCADAAKKASEAEAAKVKATSWNADTIVKKSNPPADTKPAVASTTPKTDAAPAPSSQKEPKAMKPTTAKKAAPAKKAAAKKAPTKPAKKAAATSARTPVKDKAERKPSGKVVDILKLASRENGVSPAELNKLTEWTGAPWKWLFKNPKKTGYCDRWGYTFEVFEIEPKDGKGRPETRYKTTKKP